MTVLIPIKENEDGQVVVSGRELCEFLGVKTQYTKWFERMTEYGFEEKRDYVLDSQKRLTNNPRNPTTEIIDHIVTLDMAKEISMIQRNEKGKQARQYFIQVEKAWNSPEMVMKRALQYADKKILSLEERIALDKPKTVFADAVSSSKTSILVGELAKLLKQNDINIGPNRLFVWLRDNGYLIKRAGNDWNMPTQYSMELRLFEIKETAISRSDGSTTISKTPKVTGKGQLYFINKIKETFEGVK